ncbi:addiction module toxin, RelE/StbE family [Rhizobiales bacterium GAS191]|jgi:toxin ParE1/3/4|nr:addiction module toxin, RelE/StbE family [Rhizobiales bacterium GAS113]SED64475.1 addiction module toxin, RelE/StbE family [Rhizobiales bacterium GAS191]SEE75486.1 addiction module toxin, RelE/StbE family [Rhizobiales bacterium GAS188]
MRVRYTLRAFRDREQIFEYLRERSPSGARNVMRDIRTTVTRLAEQPRSGHETDEPDVRVVFVGRYPYKIFYRVRDDVVEIAHIRHTSRAPWEGEGEARK